MQNQFAVWMAAMFGLTQCTEDLETEDTDPLPTSALVGTWMDVRTQYTSEGVDRDWVDTQRRTVIVELDGDILRFRNCLDGETVEVTVEGDTLTPADDSFPVLRLSGDDVLVPVNDTGTTDVALYRQSSAVLADLALTEPREISVWTELCLETGVSAVGQSRLAFRATNVYVGATIGMEFESPFAFDAEQILSYGGEVDDGTVTGAYDVATIGAGTLSNPRGSLVVSESSTWDFTASLTMTSSQDGGDQPIEGVLNVEPQWFNGE